MKYGSLFAPFTGKECIDDEDKKKFLRSAAYRNMIREMVVGLTGDHKLAVGLLPKEHPELAFTDGQYIMINTLHSLFIDEPITDIAKYCLALAVHESLHPLYSSFQCIGDAARKRPSETDNVVEVRQSVLNILEDARIERIGKFKFPGVAYAIEDINDFLFENARRPEDPQALDVLMQALLDFVSVGKQREKLTGKVGDVWDEIVPLAVNAKYADTCGECYRNTKKIMKLLLEFIPETGPVNNPQMMPITIQGNMVDINACTGEKPGENAAVILVVCDNSSRAGESSGGAASVVLNGVTGTGSQSGNGSSAGSGQNAASADSHGGRGAADTSQNGGYGSNGVTSNTAADSNGGKTQTGENKSENAPGMREGDGESADENSAEPGKGQPVQILGVIELKKPEDGDSEDGSTGKTDGNENGSQNEKSAGDDLMQALMQSLTASYHEHMQDQNDDLFDEKIASGLENSMAEGYDVQPQFGNYEFFAPYTEMKTDVAPVTASLKKGLKNILNYNVDELSRYQHRGKVDGKSVSRLPSGAIFSRRIEKSEEADLSITVLVDLSGSMSGSRLLNSKKACTVLQEVCHDLKIPISILGFQCGRKTVIHHFNNRKLKGRYALSGVARMSAGGGTPLADALLYLPEFLKKQKEEDKLVIVITDGAPDGGPVLSRKAVEIVSKDAKVYGLAIGDGLAVLEKIFGNRYIGVETLDQMPRELCKIIEKNLFRG